MKRNHLFASAAIGAVLAVMLPAQAQILGGGMRGGVSGVQTATFGGEFGTLHSAANSQTDLSASARARGGVDGLGRLDRTAKTRTEETGRDARRAKADAAVAGRGAVSAGEFEATKASDAARGTTRATAASTAATSATAVGQGETPVRKVGALGAVAGGLSTAEASGMKTEAANSTPSAVQPVKPDRAGGSPHASAAHDRGSPTPESKSQGGSRSGETARSSGSHVAIDANASTAEDASAH
jgi:trimeric autotransporter adhesin